MALSLAEIAAKASATNAQDQEERVNTGSSKIDKSGAYVCIVKMAKVIHANSGAVGLSLDLETEDGKKAYLTEYFVSGDAKGNKTTYTDKEGNEINLPGFSKVKAINFLLTGVSGLPSGEIKTIMEYDFDLKQEVSVEREVVTSWLNRPIGTCIQLVMEDKYNNESTSITKVEVEHFFDPVTEQFSSEKIGSKPAEMKNVFIKRVEITPVVDKRKKSKGTAPSTGSTSAPAPTTEDAGF